jgi:hypothetical protein
MSDHDLANLPPPPIPATPAPAPAPKSNMKLWVALGAVAVLGVAAFFVFRGGDDASDDSSAGEVTAPSVTEVDQSALAEDLAQAEAEAAAAQAELATLQAQVAELEAQTSSAVDPAELETARAELAEATAALEAAQALFPLLPAAVLESTLVATYQIQWGDVGLCQGLPDCSIQPDTFTDVYIDIDPATGQHQFVAPDVFQTYLNFDGIELWGGTDVADIGLPCEAEPLGTSPGRVVIRIQATSFGVGTEGRPRVEEFTGALNRFPAASSACPDSYFSRDLVLIRTSE